jgi:uncharacterized protein YozE (UPF0346 family)
MDTSADTFRQWLHRHRNDESPIGDLARDVARDACWPRQRPGDRDEEGESIALYRAHLDEHGAIAGARDALENAWRDYIEGRE